MKLLQVKYLPGLIIFALVLLYIPILNSYFQQDEWHNFGIHIYGLTSQGLSDYVLSLASTGMPLAFLYTFLNYWLFGVQNLVPAIVVLLLIIINSYLWIAIIEKISRSKFIAIGSLLIGYISYLSIQAVTWVLPAISAQATFLFINCAVWFLLEYQSKKSLKFIILSLTSAVAAALMRNNGFLIFIGLPLFSFILAKKQSRQEVMKSILLLLVLLCLAILIIFSRASNSRIGSGRYIQSETQMILNSVVLPVKSISQLFISDPQIIYKLAAQLQSRYYGRQPDPLFTQTVMTDAVSIILSLVIVVIFLLTFKLIPKRRPIFFFALTLYLLSFVPYILDKFSTGTGYLESRYYYISAFAFGLLLFIYLEFLLSKRSKYIQLLIMAIPAVLILFNAVLIRQEITLRNELTNKRKEILEYSKSEFINELDSSFIIYIQDSNIPNPLINNVTGMYFQTGFLYPFLVYVYGTGQVPASVFADDFFWDSSFQGVGKTKEYNIGLFYDYEALKKYVSENDIPSDDVLALEVDYAGVDGHDEKRGDMHDLRFVNYRNITTKVRESLSDD